MPGTGITLTRCVPAVIPLPRGLPLGAVLTSAATARARCTRKAGDRMREEHAHAHWVRAMEAQVLSALQWQFYAEPVAAVLNPLWEYASCDTVSLAFWREAEKRLTALLALVR